MYRQIFVIFLKDQWFPVVVWKSLGNKIMHGVHLKKNCNGVTVGTNILSKSQKTNYINSSAVQVCLKKVIFCPVPHK